MAGTSKPTVYKWIDRFAEGGLAALDNRVSRGVRRRYRVRCGRVF